ncbi:MAG: hypothetical protein AAFY60_10575, partial [Myxococcota bacterium]
QWVRDCRGEPIRGERFERLRPVRDGDHQRILAAATAEDPDRLSVRYVVLDPLNPCQELLRGAEDLAKPAGDVVSPGPVRLGLQRDREGALIVVDSPATTRLRGIEGRIDLLTAVTVRRWQGSASDNPWTSQRKSLLKEIDVDIQWHGEVPMNPDAIVGDSVVESVGALRGTAEGAQATAMADGDWRFDSGVAGSLTLSADQPIVLLELRHGCTLGQESTLEMSSIDGPSLYVTGKVPVQNGVFVGSASGKTRPDAPQVELGALPEPARTVGLKIGPVEKPRCIRGITAYGWTVSAPGASEPLSR